MKLDYIVNNRRVCVCMCGRANTFDLKICLLSSVLPIIPVMIPMALDLSDVVSRDLVVRRPTPDVQGL